MSRSFLIVLLLILGCNAASDGDLGPGELAEYQRTEINKVLVANHPHFTQGKPRSTSLNLDAFDFTNGGIRDMRPTEAEHFPKNVITFNYKHAQISPAKWSDIV